MFWMRIRVGMTKNLHVATSPLTGTIFAGSVLKDGRTWGASKKDVTIEALYFDSHWEDLTELLTRTLSEAAIFPWHPTIKNLLDT